MRILIIKLKTIGDVLLTTPLISNLRAQYPASIIDVLVNKGTEEVLDCNSNISHVLTYDRNKIRQERGLKKILSEFRFLLRIKKRDTT